MWFNLFLCTIITADMFVIIFVILEFFLVGLSSKSMCAQISFNNNFCWTQTDRQKVVRVSPLTVTARHETWYFSWNHSNKVWDTLFEILCPCVLCACVVTMLLTLGSRVYISSLVLRSQQAWKHVCERPLVALPAIMLVWSQQSYSNWGTPRTE